MRRRKIKHGQGPMADISFKQLACSICGAETEVDENCESVICSKCVQKRIPVDPRLLEQRKPGSSGTAHSDKPRGWRFMKEFVDAGGNVYHSGEEMPDLKGTLPLTDVAAIKAKQKEKSKERKAHKVEREAKKQAKLVKEFEKKKKILAREERKKEKEEKKRLKEQNG